MLQAAQKRRQREAEYQNLEALAQADEENLVVITPLGAGQEVGRSCIILKYQGKSIMLDCGIHPGYSGVNSLPYLDGDEETDISQVDVALITHFHLDHCAAVPYLLSKTRFKGRIFMTHPTKAIYHNLIKDFARGAKGSADQALYGEEEVDASMERIEVVDFMQTIEVAGGIQITPLRAGHVLGAAMFLIEVAGARILYTGDYSRVPDRHLPGADIPPVMPHIVIIESTYGVSRHLPRDQREGLFLQRVTDTLRAGGRVLLPVVALGRAQELLLMLDEYWEDHPELQHVPIYQASGQMRKSMRVYETYVEMMNEDIRNVFQHHNPFAFRHVTHLKSASHFDDMGPCVLMATPSGLQSGASRDAFEAWCDDRRNTVIICDFAVQGTLAREILGGPKDILTRTGYRKPLRCGVSHISFSAHADYEQTSGFLNIIQPPHVVLVHGEKTEMMRLKGALEKGAAELGCPRSVYTPAVMQPVKIHHQPFRVARAAGRLAHKPPRVNQPVAGVLVAPSGAGAGGVAAQPLLLHPDDLPAYTKLHRGRVTQRQALTTDLAWAQLRLALELMFHGVQGCGTPWSVTTCRPHGGEELSTSPPPKREKLGEEEGNEPVEGQNEEAPHKAHGGGALEEAVSVGDVVTVTFKQARAGYDSHVVVEWEGGKLSDMVADAVVAVLLQATAAQANGKGPVALQGAEAALRKAHEKGDQGEVQAAELEAVAALLATQFGPTRMDRDSGEVHVQVGGCVDIPASGTPLVVCPEDGKVQCADPTLKSRVEKAVHRLLAAMRPVSLACD